MDHSFPTYHATQNLTMCVDSPVCHCVYPRGCSLANVIPTNKQHKPKHDVFALRLLPPSHSGFNSASSVMSTLSRSKWECPTPLEYEQNVPRQQRRLPTCTSSSTPSLPPFRDRQHPPPNKNPDVEIPLAICSQFLAS